MKDHTLVKDPETHKVLVWTAKDAVEMAGANEDWEEATYAVAKVATGWVLIKSPIKD